MKMLNKQKV